jgi:hypothetical protein
LDPRAEFHHEQILQRLGPFSQELDEGLITSRRFVLLAEQKSDNLAADGKPFGQRLFVRPRPQEGRERHGLRRPGAVGSEDDAGERNTRHKPFECAMEVLRVEALGRVPSLVLMRHSRFLSGACCCPTTQSPKMANASRPFFASIKKG